MSELCWADLAQEIADVLSELRRFKLVVDAIAITALAHEVGGLQDRQMSRDRRTGDVETTRDRAGRELAVLQLLEDLSTGRICQSAEGARCVLHSFAI